MPPSAWSKASDRISDADPACPREAIGVEGIGERGCDGRYGDEHEMTRTRPGFCRQPDRQRRSLRGDLLGAGDAAADEANEIIRDKVRLGGGDLLEGDLLEGDLLGGGDLLGRGDLLSLNCLACSPPHVQRL